MTSKFVKKPLDGTRQVRDFAAFIQKQKPQKDEVGMRDDMYSTVRKEYWDSWICLVAFNGIARKNISERLAYGEKIPQLVADNPARSIKNPNDIYRSIVMDVLAAAGGITRDDVLLCRRTARFVQYFDLAEVKKFELKKGKVEFGHPPDYIYYVCLSDVGHFLITHSSQLSKIARAIGMWKVRCLYAGWTKLNDPNSLIEATALATKIDSLSRNIAIDDETVYGFDETKLTVVAIGGGAGGEATSILSAENLKRGQDVLSKLQGKDKSAVYSLMNGGNSPDTSDLTTIVANALAGIMAKKK